MQGSFIIARLQGCEGSLDHGSCVLLGDAIALGPYMLGPERNYQKRRDDLDCIDLALCRCCVRGAKDCKNIRSYKP